MTTPHCLSISILLSEDAYFCVLRKEKKGGDVLAWMSRRANVSVRVFLEGKDRILDRAMYKMKLLAAEDSDSSYDEPPSKADHKR